MMRTNLSLLRILVAAAATAVLAAAPLVAGDDEWTRTRDPGDIMLDESAELAPGGDLDVDVSDVSIELKYTSGRTANVKVYVSGRDQDEAREYFEDLDFRVHGDDDRLLVDTRKSRWFDVSWSWHHHRRVRVWAVITVPEGTPVKVATDDGDIAAEKLTSKSYLRTSDGNINIGDAAGEELTIRTSDGDVHCDHLDAPRVDVSTSDGSITVERANGGVVSLGTSDGNVVVTQATATELHMRTSDGDIRADVTAERVKARTSDGNIRIKLHSDVEANLHTTDGDIYLEVPANIKANLDLRGDRVHLEGNANVNGTISRNRVKGTLKGGGPDIVARTTDGRISLDLR